MKLKKSVKITAFSSVMSALITSIIVVGSLIEVFDLICASICSLTIHIINKKTSTRTALMIYAVSSALSVILLPLRSCSLYFLVFFGYYPIIREFFGRKIKSKIISYLLLLLIYNITMISLFMLFSNLFGINNEPVYMYIALIISSNMFYVAFDLLISRVMIIFDYKVSKFFKSRRDNK